MGHRDELLSGARECLHHKGWSRTSARDVVAASNTNLASIGYHFGSKDALLTQALVELTGEVPAALDKALTEALTAGEVDASPDRLATTWARVVDDVARDDRLRTAMLEALAQAGRVPEVRAALARAQELTREDLALTFHAAGEDEDRVRVLGAFYQALLVGVLVQWAVDPATAPSGADVAAALRALISDGEQP